MNVFGNKKVLITGGAGFIGSHLVEELIELGANVTVVDIRALDYVPSDKYDKHPEFVQLDIQDTSFYDLLREARFDMIFHLASNAYVPPSLSNPGHDFRVNLLATFQLLETIRSLDNKPIFIYASSAAVYGNPVNIPIREQDPTVPISPYGVSKLACERYLSVYANAYELGGASLRLFSVYGPWQKKQVVFDILQKLHRDPSQLHLLGDGTQQRDLVYVTDVVRAFILVANCGPLRGEVYNVGTGCSVSILELAHMISKTVGVSPKIHFSGSVRSGDPDKWIADISRLRQLGYHPLVGLEEGVANTVRWFHTIIADRKARNEGTDVG